MDIILIVSPFREILYYLFTNWGFIPPLFLLKIQ
nr:MAG TPA: hypothetical protein [Caudoviricetes sp.]DAW69018.1 MAG TPA: hypothetical protein [Caudoviricetes sp.]